MLLKIIIKIGFWFPILLSVITNINHFDLYICYGNIILALTIIFTSNILNFKKINTILEVSGVLVFNLFMFIQISHLHLFKEHIKSSTLFILFDSNYTEGSEFLSMYIDSTITFVFFLLLLFLSLSIFLRVYNVNNKISLKFKLVSLFIIVVSMSFYKIRAATFPHIIFKAIKEYRYDKKKLNKITQDNFGGIFSEVKHNNTNENETYVLIIGESTTRHHMQLYDYSRETNPKLNLIKEDLLIYNDVISPHTHTIPSLEKVLTLASNKTPNKKYSGTLIQLFNKAGFKTYWVSNQKPLGIYETATTIVSKNCAEQVFVNITYKSLDEGVLKPLKTILKQKNKKKFIVIHLMGSHSKYENRYPVSYHKFKSKPETKFNHEKAFEAINTYDNAILYNDFIINEIVKEIENTNSKSYALYISDHGEDVYETIDMACHMETEGTKPMYDIPFILWRSKKFKKDSAKFVFDMSRKYSSENLIYTLSDLASLTFKEFDSTKSIVNKNFKQENRIILNNKEYDDFFNSKK